VSSQQKDTGPKLMKINGKNPPIFHLIRLNNLLTKPDYTKVNENNERL
jgi:hypothetical protein